MSPAEAYISIVIPTYKRPQLLRRAVASAMAQTYPSWELIISDDEDPPGETSAYLQELAAHDSRIRVIRNSGPHGQAGNMNNAMRVARGQWIKPLYDDDELLPDCLAVFLAAAEAAPGAVLCTCLLDRYQDGQLVRSGARQADRWPVQLLPQSHIHLAMYLGDVRVGMPTQIMVQRRCLDRGVWFEELPGLSYCVDEWWFARVLQHGDLLIINKVLAHEHQGSVVSVTSSLTEKDKDREMFQIKDKLRPLVNPRLHAPSLRVVHQQVHLTRAFHLETQTTFGGSVIGRRRLAPSGLVTGGTMVVSANVSGAISLGQAGASFHCEYRATEREN